MTLLSIPAEILAEIIEYTGRVEQRMLGWTCKELATGVLAAGPRKIRLFDMYEISATNGWVGIMGWLKDYIGRVLPVDGKKAARGGHLEVIKWVQQNSYLLKLSRVFDGAASGGHLAVIEWMSGLRGSSSGMRTIVLKAAKYGHIHVIEWADKHYGPQDIGRANAIYYAAVNGQLETLKWLDTHEYQWTGLEMDYIIRYGPLCIIKYCYNANHDELNGINLMADVLLFERLDIAKWLYKKGVVVEAYASGHHISRADILEWLTEIKYIR